MVNLTLEEKVDKVLGAMPVPSDYGVYRFEIGGEKVRELASKTIGNLIDPPFHVFYLVERNRKIGVVSKSVSKGFQSRVTGAEYVSTSQLVKDYGHLAEELVEKFASYL